MNNNTTTKPGISYKKYQCQVCKNIEEHQTNHFGGIYVNCKNCGHNGLSCIEPEAIEATKNNPVIVTKLHKYRYDISDKEQSEEYKALHKRLKAAGFKFFNVWETANHIYFDNLPDTIAIDISYVFDDQWNSNAGRVHDWYESIYPNKKIKNGYWLELTEEHAKAREPRTYKCKTYYKDELLGEDTVKAINTDEASNILYAKYFKEGMDIWEYKKKIELA